VTCFESTIWTNWLQNFISELGIDDNIVKPLKTNCDNLVAVFFPKTKN